MRKLLLTTLLAISTLLSAQITITMEQDGGVYKVPCVVNGAKMKFIFDTGAATVCLSESMAEYLLDNDYITKEDILGTGTSQVADGRIVDHVKINLRDIEIAGLHLKDVEAVVVVGQHAPLLLGQSAIQQLGLVSIRGNKLIINSMKKKDSSLEPIRELSDDDEYEIYNANNRLLKAYEGNDMSIIALKMEEYYMIYWKFYRPKEDERYKIAYQYFRAENYNKTKYWLQQIKDKDELSDLENYYYLYAELYKETLDYSHALFYYTKAQDETLDTDMWRRCQYMIEFCEGKLAQ